MLKFVLCMWFGVLLVCSSMAHATPVWKPLNGDVHFLRTSTADSAVVVRSRSGNVVFQSYLQAIQGPVSLKTLDKSWTDAMLWDEQESVVLGQAALGGRVSPGLGQAWQKQLENQTFVFEGAPVVLTNTQNISLLWTLSSANVQPVSQWLLQQVTGNQWTVAAALSPTQNQVEIHTQGGHFVLRKWFRGGVFLDSDGESFSGSMGDARYWKRIVVDTVAPSITTASVVVRQHTVDRDHVQLQLKSSEPAWLFWEVLSPTSNVGFGETLSDYRDAVASENLFYFSMREQIGTASASALWTGLSHSGYQQEGVYRYRYYVQDLAGNYAAPVTGSVLLDTRPPFLSLLPETSVAFSPNGDGLYDAVEIHVTANKGVALSYTLIETSRNRIVWSRAVTQNVLGDVVSVNAGMGLSDGRYLLSVLAKDHRQQVSTRSVMVTVDTSPPRIAMPTQSVFAGEVSHNQILLTVDEPGMLTWSVSSLNITVTQNLLAGKNSLFLSLPVVPDSRYHSMVSVQDAVGNMAYASMNLIVDRQPPSLTSWHLPTLVDLRRPVSVSYVAEDLLAPGVSARWWVSTGNSKTRIADAVLSGVSVNLSEQLLRALPTAGDGLYVVGLDIADTYGNEMGITRSVSFGRTPVSVQLSAPMPPMSIQHGVVTLPYVLSNGGLTTLQSLKIGLWRQGVLVHLLEDRVSKDADAFGLGAKTLSLAPEWGAALADGVYELRFDTVSAVGIPGAFGVSVDIDHAPPLIVSVNISQQPYAYATAPIQIRVQGTDRTGVLSQASLWYQGQPLAETGVFQGGQGHVTFNGLVQGKRLPDGAHAMSLVLVDGVGNRVSADVSLSIDTTPPTLTGFSRSSGLLQAQGGASDRVVTFGWQSGELAQSEVTILRENGTVYRRFFDPVFSTSREWVWDGRSDQQDIADGTYQIRTVLTDKAGNSAVFLAPDTVVISNAKPAVTNLRVSPAILAEGTTTTILFDVPQDGVLFASVLDPSGTTLNVLANGVAIKKSEGGRVLWPGTSTTGAPVRDGEYLLVLRYRDKHGIELAEAVKRVLYVDRTAPYVTQVTANHTALGVGDTALERPFVMRFSLSEASSVNVVLTSATGNAQVLDTLSLAAGKHSWEWPFAIQKTQMPGVYHVDLQITDMAGNKTVYRQTVTLTTYVPLEAKPDHAYTVFSPNGDAVAESAAMAWRVSGSGKLQVHAGVYTRSGRLLRDEGVVEVVSGGRVAVEWLGRDALGALQPDGEYQWRLTVKDSLGQQQVYQLPIYLLTQPATLAVSDNGPVFSFNGDGLYDSLVFDLELRYPDMLYGIEGYNKRANLKWQIVQQGKTIQESFIQIIDKYTGTYDGAGLSEGPFEMRISGESEGRIQVTTVSMNYVQDVTGPTFSGFYVSDSSWGVVPTSDTRVVSAVSSVNYAAVTFMAAASDASYMVMSDSTGTQKSVSGSIGIFSSLVFPEDGAYPLSVYAVDALGNKGAPAVVTLHVDRQSPDLVAGDVMPYSPLSGVGTPKDVVSTGSYQVKLVFDEPIKSGVTPQVRLVSAQHTEIPVTMVVCAERECLVLFEVTETAPNGPLSAEVTGYQDTAGNQQSLSWDALVAIDTLSPVAPLLYDQGRVTNNMAYQAIFATEPQTTVWVKVDDEAPVSAFVTEITWALTLSLPEGEHLLTAGAEDLAGNQSAVFSHPLNVDVTPPQVLSSSWDTMTVPYAAGGYTGSLWFSEPLDSAVLPTGYWAVGSSRVPVAVTSVTGNHMQIAWSVADTDTNGTYHLYIEGAYDHAGNRMASATVGQLVVDTEPPMVAQLSQAHTVVNVPLYMDTLVLPESTLGVTVWADGAKVSELPVSADRYSLAIPLSEGQHTLAFQTQDMAGNRSVTLSHTVEVDLTPIGGFVTDMDTKAAFKAGVYHVSVVFDDVVGEVSDVTVFGIDALPVTVDTVSGNTMWGRFTVKHDVPNGVYRLRVGSVTDKARNLSPALSGASWVIDTQVPPTPSLGTALPLQQSGTYVDTVHAEPGSVVNVMKDGGIVASYSATEVPFSLSLSLTEGVHTLSIGSMDLAGNFSGLYTHEVAVDQTPPVVGGLPPVVTAVTTGDVVIRFTIVDPPLVAHPPNPLRGGGSILYRGFAF